MSTIVTRSGKGSPLTHAEVDSNFTNLNTDKLELSGGTMTGDVGHNDGVKATFGASNDLEIYHDGSASYIEEKGTGSLYIKGTQLRMQATDGTTYLEANDGGALVIKHGGTTKFTTTSGGIDVTGTVEADGAQIDGNVTIGRTTGSYIFTEVDGGSERAGIHSSADNDLTFKVANAVTAINIDGNTRDISFYEDTGTTAKFFWDASAERLGLGTTSPETSIHIVSSQPSISLGDGTFPNDRFINIDAKIAGDDAHGITVDNADSIVFGHKTNNQDTSMSSEAMRIDSSGNLLIDRTVSALGGGNGALLQIGSGSGGSGMTIHSSTTGTGDIQFADGTTGADSYRGLIRYEHSSDNMNFWVNSAQKMSIDSSGNLEMTGGGSIGWANFTLVEEGGYLYVYNGSTKIMRVDASGNAAFAGDVEANATL